MSGPRLVAVAMLAVGLSLPLTALAQPSASAVLTGRVTDAASGTPLSGAHVFVSRTTTGTATAPDGRFRLSVHPGATRLVVSMVGYATRRLDLFLRPDTTVTLSVRLSREVVEAGEVVVEGERDEKWYKDLEKFERLFLGESTLADSCRLLNSTVLRFDSGWWKGLEATAAAPLRIENRALGYRVQYTLKAFDQSGSVVKWDGDSHFEPLTPSDSAQAARWQSHRRDAYYGSLRHFLRALIDDRVHEEGFRMQRIPRAHLYRDAGRARRYPARRRHVIAGRTDSTYQLDVRGRLEVTYTEAPESRGYLRWSRQRDRVRRSVQTSWIELNDPPVHVDRYGQIVEPYGATVFGYFAYEQRLSGLLPRDYTPE